VARLNTAAVKVWSGREVRALRAAKRMSIRAFAAHLGVSERMISKWEKGDIEIHPRPVNQHALDSSLAASGAEVHARFTELTAGRSLTANIALVRHNAAVAADLAVTLTPAAGD
jgi:DNA-binding transcriptional regulator YiaG